MCLGMLTLATPVLADRPVASCTQCDLSKEVCNYNRSTSQHYCVTIGTLPTGIDQSILNAVGEVFAPPGIDPSPNAISNYIPTATTAIFVVGLIALLFYLALGGIRWISSGGDKKMLMIARDTIMQAITGMLLLSVGFGVAKVAEIWLGGGKGVRDIGSERSIRICGYCPPGYDKNLCASIHLSKCKENYRVLTEAQYAAIPPQMKNYLCSSESACNAGCAANDQLGSYVYCRPY